MANKVVAVTLTARTAQYVAQMGAAAKSTAAVGTAAGGAAVAAQPLDRSLRNAARATGILNPKLIGSAGLVLGLKSVVTQAKDFEDQFAMVRKTMQESDDVLDQVALNIRDMATDMPITTEELNRIATVAGQLGIAADDVSGFTETMAQLSVTTNLTAEGAAIDFARLSNIMGKPIDEVHELGNVVVHLGNNMAAQETEIMEFAKRIAGVGTQMGMAEHEILALSAALPALGLRAEMGGTAITRIMVEVNAAVTEGTDKLGIFAQTAGMSAEEFAAAWREDPSGTLMAFTAGIGTMSEAGVDAFETISDLDLSMIRTQDTALRLAGGTEVYAEAVRLANEETEKQSAVQEEWDKRMQTTASQIDIFKNKVREMALEVGMPLNTALGDTVRLVNDILTGLRDDDWDRLLFRWDQDNNPDTVGNRARGGNRAAGTEMLLDLGYRQEDIDNFYFGLERAREATLEFGGHMDRMPSTMRRAREATAEFGGHMDRMPRTFADAQESSDGWTSSLGQNVDALDVLREEMAASEAMSNRLTEAFELLAGVNISAERAAIRVAEGFDNLTETLSENGDTLDRNTEKGRENELAIMSQADAIMDEIKRRHEQGESIGQVMAAYDNHIEKLRDVMREAGFSEDAIESYIDMLGLTPEQVRTTIVVDDFASQTIEDYIRRLGRVPRRITTQLRTEARIGGSLAGNQSGIGDLHTGGYVHPSGQIQKFHSGGMVGGLRHDEVPAILQTGEMVLSRSQVSQIGAAFSNAQPRAAGHPLTVVMDGKQHSGTISGEGIVAALREYERRNGPGWRS